MTVTNLPSNCLIPLLRYIATCTTTRQLSMMMG